MIARVHHVQICVPKGKEAEARRFYGEVLGLREIEKAEALRARGGFWMEVGEIQVHVGVEEGVAYEKTKAHVAYEVRDLAAWRRKLEALGIALIDGEPIPGMRRFELRDPFGNRIELLERMA